MILAAGRGERLRPLTDQLPKPLLTVGGRRLIEHHLLALAAAGFSDVVINVAYLAQLILDALGDGSQYGLRIKYSHEMPGELDTGGGIRQALELLDTGAPFAVINADVLTDFPMRNLRGVLDSTVLEAHLVLAPNPPHHPKGDFGLRAGRVTRQTPHFTFTGIGVYRPELFRRQSARRFGLASILYAPIAQQNVGGQLYSGRWHDVGTPAAFAALGGTVSPDTR